MIFPRQFETFIIIWYLYVSVKISVTKLGLSLIFGFNLNPAFLSVEKRHCVITKCLLTKIYVNENTRPDKPNTICEKKIKFDSELSLGLIRNF